MSKYNQIKTIDDFFKRFHYNIKTDLIGNGAFGKVYKALDTVLHREVAIKVSEVKIIDGREFSLKDEFKALENLGSHPNIANYEYVFTFETQQGIFDYAIIQFYKEGNLDHIIQKDKLYEWEKESISIQLLRGIEFLHSNNIIHRDLKPSNILVHVYDKSKVREIIPLITDFGLSKKATNNKNSLINNSFSGGTIGYSSPEQLKNNEIRLNSDLWAYGAIVYEIFTGKQLFTYNNTTDAHKQQIEIYNQIMEHDFYHKLNELPEKWQKVVQVCLVRDPEIRVKSANVILQKLEEKDTIPTPEFKIIQPESYDEKGKVEVTVPIGEGYEYSIDSKNFLKSPIFENLKIGHYTLTVKNEYNITNKINFVIKNEGSVIDMVAKPKKNVFPKIDISRYRKSALIGLGTIISISTILLAYTYIKPLFEENQEGNDVVIKTPIDTIPNFYNREKTIILNKLNQKDFDQVIALSESLKKRLPNTKTSMISQLDSLKSVAENSLKSENTNWKINYESVLQQIKSLDPETDFLKIKKIAESQIKIIPISAKTEREILDGFIKKSVWKKYYNDRIQITLTEAKKGNWEVVLSISKDLLNKVPLHDKKNKDDINRIIEVAKIVVERQKKWKPYEMYPIGNNMILVKKDGFYGTVDKLNYKTVIGLEYKFISITPNSNEKIIIGNYKEGSVKFDYNGNKL